jgi:hypothetical protein
LPVHVALALLREESEIINRVWPARALVIVVVVIVVVVVVMVVGHGVANRRPAHAAHNGADGSAHDGSANRAGNATRHRPA